MSDKYILDAQGAVQSCDDLHAWGAWMQSANRTVAKTTLEYVRVSTVFLGLDHSFGGPGPVLFETMVFPPDSYGELAQDRYATREQAEAGHAAMVAKWTGRKATE